MFRALIIQRSGISVGIFVAVPAAHRTHTLSEMPGIIAIGFSNPALVLYEHNGMFIEST